MQCHANVGYPNASAPSAIPILSGRLRTKACAAALGASQPERAHCRLRRADPATLLHRCTRRRMRGVHGRFKRGSRHESTRTAMQFFEVAGEPTVPTPVAESCTRSRGAAYQGAPWHWHWLVAGHTRMRSAIVHGAWAQECAQRQWAGPGRCWAYGIAPGIWPASAARSLRLARCPQQHPHGTPRWRPAWLGGPA